MYKNKRKLHATQSFIFKNEKDSYWYRERHHPLGVVKIGHGNPLGNPCRLGTLLSPAVTINLSFHRGRSHFLMSLHQVLFCMKFHHWKSSEQSTMQELACFSKSLNYKGRKKKNQQLLFTNGETKGSKSAILCLWKSADLILTLSLYAVLWKDTDLSRSGLIWSILDLVLG